jgi:hypothetical protein
MVMEKLVNMEEEYEEDLQLFTKDLDNLKKAGKWGKFISIVIALNTVGFGFFYWAGTITSGGYAGRTTKVYLLIYLLFFGLTIYFCTLLFQFSSKAISAVENESQDDLSNAFTALAMMFKTGGRLIIIYLLCIALTLLAAFGIEWPYS